MLRKIFLSGCTCILTSHGYKPLFELNDRDVLVWCQNRFQEMTIEFVGMEEDAYMITFENGTRVTCGANHRWITQTGLKPSTDLREKDVIVQHRFPHLDVYNQTELINEVPLNKSLETKKNWLSKLKNIRMTAPDCETYVLATFDTQFIRTLHMMLASMNIYSEIEIDDIWTSKLTMYEKKKPKDELRIVEIVHLAHAVKIYSVFTFRQEAIVANGVYV